MKRDVLIECIADDGVQVLASCRGQADQVGDSLVIDYRDNLLVVAHPGRLRYLRVSVDLAPVFVADLDDPSPLMQFDQRDLVPLQTLRLMMVIKNYERKEATARAQARAAIRKAMT